MVDVQELFGYIGLFNLYDFQMERTHNSTFSWVLSYFPEVPSLTAVLSDAGWPRNAMGLNLLLSFQTRNPLGSCAAKCFVREECSFRLFLACNISAQYFCGKFYVKLLSRDHLMFLFEWMEIPKTMLCFGENKTSSQRCRQVQNYMEAAVFIVVANKCTTQSSQHM
ncbi:hypothetical protein ACE6H2_004052 [Prunus campanulata]